MIILVHSFINRFIIYTIKTSYFMDQVVKFIEDAIAPLDIEIMINAKPNMKFLKAKPLGHKKIKLPVFSGDDSISGIINIKLKN